MGLEEIDESYRKEVDSADKEFVAAIKSKANIKEAETIYLKKLKNAREKYSRLVGKNLGSLKGVRKKAVKVKDVKTQAFKVNLERYNLTGFEKLKFKIGLFKFKLRISLRNLRRSLTPRVVFYYFVVARFKVKRFFKRNVERLGDAFDSIKNFFVKSYESLKEVMKKAYEKLSKFPEQMMTKLKSLRKKGEKKTGENKGEEKKSNYFASGKVQS